MKCNHCGSANAATAKFCQGCSRSLAGPAGGVKTQVNPALAASKAASPVVVPPVLPVALNAAVPGRTLIRQTLLGNDQREHTVMVLDRSGSMCGQCNGRFIKLEAAKRAMKGHVVEKHKIDPNDEMGVISFDSAACVQLPITSLATGKARVFQAIDALIASGGTDINEGLKAARDLFNWSHNGVIRRIVLLTDGHGGHPLHTAEDLKGRGVVIDVIGVGPDPSAVDEKLLRKVASTVQGELRYRFIDQEKTLVDHGTSIAAKTQIQ